MFTGYTRKEAPAASVPIHRAQKLKTDLELNIFDPLGQAQTFRNINLKGCSFEGRLILEDAARMYIRRSSAVDGDPSPFLSYARCRLF